ncbi:MAG: hypothetical protein H0W84_10655 [Bacteroidetes bacterium]|nr:hypothetical protein [Bacteroidota bacterium]
MKEHHKIKSLKINAIRCENLDEEFATYLQFHLSKLKGVKAFTLFNLKRGFIFKKKVFTLSILFESSKLKDENLNEIGSIIRQYYKDRSDFIDFLPLSQDNKLEKPLFQSIISCNVHIWNF